MAHCHFSLRYLMSLTKCIVDVWTDNFNFLSPSNFSKYCDGWFLAEEDFWEAWWSVFARSLVPVESDSWCADPTALWTGERLGWGWLECCWLFLPPASFLCSFMPLSASNLWLAFLTDKRQISRSEAFCCHYRWLILTCANCLFSWYL